MSGRAKRTRPDAVRSAHFVPTRPSRPCLEQGCAALVTTGSRCAQHRRSTTHRQTSDQRGYTRQWHNLAKQMIAEQPWCTWLDDPRCRWSGDVRDLTGDHIVPLSEGGESVRENVRILCRACNTRARHLRGQG